jgi:hypothetical protein
MYALRNLVNMCVLYKDTHKYISYNELNNYSEILSSYLLYSLICKCDLGNILITLCKTDTSDMQKWSQIKWENVYLKYCPTLNIWKHSETYIF